MVPRVLGVQGEIYPLDGMRDQTMRNQADYQMDETSKVEGYLKDLLNVMVSRAEKEVDAILPGYTHLQVSLGAS